SWMRMVSFVTNSGCKATSLCKRFSAEHEENNIATTNKHRSLHFHVRCLKSKVKCDMLYIGDKIIQLRKLRNLSQTDLAQKVEASRTIIGNYERNENTHSIEMIIKISKVFNVSVDYIIGEGVLSQYDKEVLKRIDDIEKLDDETKNKMFFLIDNIIQNFKTKQAFAK
ncbi:MAG TPA: helix-turn-helix transcriptional regulator, partial [Bacteroidales bacterium]|nr:helix-turn-helix transcriptional regulator [Bacteroidales bacterium]